MGKETFRAAYSTASQREIIAAAKAAVRVWGEGDARVEESCGCVWCDLNFTGPHPCQIIAEGNRD